MPSDAYNQAMTTLGGVAADMTSLSTQEINLGSRMPSLDASQCSFPWDAAVVVNTANNYTTECQGLISQVQGGCSTDSSTIDSVVNGLPSDMDPSERQSVTDYANGLRANISSHQGWAASETSWLNGTFIPGVSNLGAAVNQGYQIQNAVDSWSQQV